MFRLQYECMLFLPHDLESSTLGNAANKVFCHQKKALNSPSFVYFYYISIQQVWIVYPSFGLFSQACRLGHVCRQLREMWDAAIVYMSACTLLPCSRVGEGQQANNVVCRSRRQITSSFFKTSFHLICALLLLLPPF